MADRGHQSNADTPIERRNSVDLQAIAKALLCALAIVVLLTSVGTSLAVAGDDTTDGASENATQFGTVDGAAGDAVGGEAPSDDAGTAATSANAALFGNDRTETDAEAEEATATDGPETNAAVEEQANPCPLDPPAPPAEIFEEPNRSDPDAAELTPMEAFAEQKANAYLDGFTAREYPAVDEYDLFSPYCLGVEAVLRAQSEEAAGEPPSYDGTGFDRAVDFYLGYVTGVFPEGDGFDETHPFVQGVEERLRDDPITRAAAEQRAAELAAAESEPELDAGVYGASVYAAVVPAEAYVEPAPAAVYAPAAEP